MNESPREFHEPDDARHEQAMQMRIAQIFQQHNIPLAGDNFFEQLKRIVETVLRLSDRPLRKAMQTLTQEQGEYLLQQIELCQEEIASERVLQKEDPGKRRAVALSRLTEVHQETTPRAFQETAQAIRYELQIDPSFIRQVATVRDGLYRILSQDPKGELFHMAMKELFDDLQRDGDLEVHGRSLAELLVNFEREFARLLRQYKPVAETRQPV